MKHTGILRAVEIQDHGLRHNSAIQASSLKPQAQWRSVLAVLLISLCGCDKCDKEQPGSDPGPSRLGNKESNLERILAAKVLKIGVRSDSPPFGYQDKDGNPAGFDVDLGFRLARSLGVQPVFVTVSSPERIERLKNGDVDLVIATLTATRRRAHEIDFSIPYFQDHQMLLVETSSAIQSYRDLSGKRVAAALRSTSIDNLKVVAPDCEIVPVQSVAVGFEKLNSGAVDALTGDGLVLQSFRLNAADPSKFRIAGEGFSVEPYVIGLPYNDSQLRARVDEFLTEIWNSGVWTRLFNKWLGAQSPYNLEASFQMAVLPP